MYVKYTGYGWIQCLFFSLLMVTSHSCKHLGLSNSLLTNTIYVVSLMEQLELQGEKLRNFMLKKKKKPEVWWLTFVVPTLEGRTGGSSRPVTAMEQDLSQKKGSMRSAIADTDYQNTVNSFTVVCSLNVSLRYGPMKVLLYLLSIVLWINMWVHL